MPEVLNTNDEKPEESNSNAEERRKSAKKENGISYMAIFGNLRSFLVISSCVFASIFLMFNEPIISEQLVKTGLSDQLVGYVFGLACIAYALAAPLIACLASRFNKESLSFFAFLLSGIQLFI